MHPRSLFPEDTPLARVRVTPDEPDAIVARRPRGSRRPHADLTVAKVRHLIETTELTYGEIAKRTGVGRASICRWTQDFGWQRTGWAPRATDRMPTARASHRLKARTLFRRLAALAERHIRELEASACVDPDKLAEALELMKMAKVAAMPRRRKRKPSAASDTLPQPAVPAPAGSQNAPAQEQAAPGGYARAAMRELRAGGVNTWRAPDAALEEFIETRAPPPKNPPRRRPGRRLTLNERHLLMLRPIAK